MRQRTLAVLIVMFFICARGFAGDSMDKRRVQLEMDERAVQLASKLKISLGQQEHIKKSRRALSSLKIENIENLIFKIDTVHSKLSEIVIERKDALNSQDKVVMVGKICECDSFEEARVRLLNELVFCSLPIEMIMERYELSQVDIGNLCIVGKLFDMKAQKYLPSDIHFVRGSTMISLRSETTPSVDIYGIAKALDAVLKSLDMKDDVSSAATCLPPFHQRSERRILRN